MKTAKHNILHYILTFLYTLAKSLIGSVFWLILAGVGYLVFQLKKSPYDLIFGLPLLLVGIGFTINLFLSSFYALFYPKYNKGVCPFCGKSQPIDS